MKIILLVNKIMTVEQMKQQCQNLLENKDNRFTKIQYEYFVSEVQNATTVKKLKIIEREIKYVIRDNYENYMGISKEPSICSIM